MLFCEKLSTTKTELIFCFSCYMKINHCNLQPPPPTFIQMQEVLTPTSYPHPPLSNFYFSSKITAHNYEIIAVLNYVFRELYKKRTISVWTIHTQVLDRWRGGLKILNIPKSSKEFLEDSCSVRLEHKKIPTLLRCTKFSSDLIWENL